MSPDLSQVPSSSRLPRILIAENNFSTVDSLIRTFRDRRLELDYDVCSSHNHAVTKIFHFPPHYQMVISNVHLAEVKDFLLIKHNRNMQPFVPFVVTVSGSETESSRRALEEGAFDFITTPLESEETVATIRLALWQSRLLTLIASNERATEKYREHMAAYPFGNDMDDHFKKTLSAIQQSILSYHQSLLQVEGFADLATEVKARARKRALERLDKLSK
ncbi:MAG TPA: response regulator [Nitrospira sp.]|nr:response regulator [Nitrospira sp.]